MANETFSDKPLAVPAVSEVAATVRAEMARRQITQGALAAHLHLSQPAVSRRLSGEKAFDVHELSAISSLLSVPLRDLIPAA